MGNMWGGVETFLIALVQGLFAEIAFAVFAYKKWNLGVTVLSGALVAGVAMWYLYLGIARTGALDQFASGRAVRGAKH